MCECGCVCVCECVCVYVWARVGEWNRMPSPEKAKWIVLHTELVKKFVHFIYFRDHPSIQMGNN